MSGSCKVVGVLGGMGPEATVDFMAKVIALTPATKDEDHVRMMVDHNPKIPNRQAAILNDGEDPGPDLAAMAVRLEAAGADFLVIPCNTAHVFEDHVLAAVGIPLVSIIDVTVAAIGERCSGADAVGVLATDGCLHADIYQKALKRAGLRPLLLDNGELDDLIAKIKAGDKGEDVSRAMRDLANTLVKQGAQAIIAGCTEIPLVLDEASLDVPLISSTDVLAQKTVALACGDEPLPDRE